MIYALFKFIFKLTLNSYFKVIKISGKENIPKHGPVIFVANHPSTLMDPLVLGVMMKKHLHFLAADEFMGKGLLRYILQKSFNMIPIYRPHTRPSEASKNIDAFEECFEHLENDGVILIFPEGSSVTANRLRPLKTGMARIALGTEFRSKTNKKVQIVPIGLNYGDSHSFRNDLFVNIGEPITSDEDGITTIKDEYAKTKALTQLVEDRLKNLLIHIDDEKLDAIFDKIGQVINHHILPNLTEKTNPKAKFKLDQQIQKGLHYHYEKNPLALDVLNKKLDIYMGRVKFYGTSDSSLASLSPKIKMYDYLRIFFGIPLFALGYILNFVPFHGAVMTYRQLKIDLNFRGSIGLTIGLVYFLIWYIGLGVVIANLFHLWWMGFLFFTVGYLSGRFTMHYFNLLDYLRKKGRLKKLLKTDRNILRSLLHERESIIKDIEKYSEVLS